MNDRMGYWTVSEGGPVALLGVLILRLNERAFGQMAGQDSDHDPG